VSIRHACATIALAIVAATITASAHSSTSSGAQNARVRSCTTAQLKIRLVRSFAAASNVGGYIGFVNRASAPCSLTGWPTLVALTRLGRSTTALHVRSTMFGPYIAGIPVVALRPGKMAEVAFAAGDNPGPGKTTCPPPYRHLRITPPGNSHSALLSAWLPYLDAYLPACTGITVTMVVPASDLQGG
jgi:hypothetical protein